MSQVKPMMLSRLQALFEAYGAEPLRFPAEERAAARALLATDVEAQRLQREAAQLDALLDTEAAFSASPALQARVAELPIRHRRESRASTVFSPRGVWGAVFAGVFVCLLGALSGAWLDLDADAGVATDTSDTADASDDADDGWDDMATVALAQNFGKEL